MSDQFYNYLSNKIIEFFNSQPLNSGAKYNIQFENKSEVKALYEELKNSTLYKEFEYKDDNGDIKYTSYLLNFSGVKLIISATIDDIQPDFLTRLRNMVGVEPGYEDKAILFIHDTNLDSIMGGTESFNKEGMPFHIDSIKEDIKKKMVTSDFSKVDRTIINSELEGKQGNLYGDRVSVFEYRELLQIINGTCIEKDQYRDFELFYDSELKDLKGKKLKDRIDENSLYYKRVNEIHNYGNPEVQLERYFDENGIEKLKKEDWQSTDFVNVNKSIEEKKKVKPLEYIPSDQVWDKEEGHTKAKSRTRNIIVFNEDGLDSVDLEFQFDDYLKNEFLKAEGDLDAKTSGKRIKITINKSKYGISFYKVIYKNEKNLRFQFKIVMLELNEKYFDSVKTKFSIVMRRKKDPYISIDTDDFNIVLNPYAKIQNRHNIESNNDIVQSNKNEKLTINISDNFEHEDDDEIVRFVLRVNQCEIPMGIVGTSEKSVVIEGLKLWKLKRETKSDFIKIGDNKFQHGTKEYYTRDEFRKNLELEEQIVNSDDMYFIETIDGLEPRELDLNPKLKSSYREILQYFSTTNKVPSLTYLNDDLKILYNNFIKEYIEELEKIKEDSCIVKKQKDLFKIGIINKEIEDKELIFTPLHPLNIVYQLYIDESIDNKSMEEDIIKKFTSTYLLPYILEDDKLYIPMEQYHSPGWKYYVEENLPRYKGSRDFVSKLVYEKIEEFVGHFKYLFNMGKNAPIKINLINTGDSKEILQGIFKYYMRQLKSSKVEELLPIDIFIYSNKNITNVFEELAFNDDLDDLKETYELDLKLDNMSEEDVFNLYREKVNFYSKDIEDEIEYSHITFLEMDNDAKTITSKMDQIPSGIMLNGLISGVPSVFLGDSYRTGFGTKYTNTNSDLMRVAMNLNALNCAMGGEPYDKKHCKAISIPNKNKSILDNIYESSNWVTFIDPKVDLNFFKNDPDVKDLLIIHYSDQYTTAGGYDAITVTRKSNSYQRVIEEFLTQKGIEDSQKYSPSIINMFNAVNGDWLLRLLSSKSHFPKEKISILSAITLALAEFKRENVIWVPMSLEEILRVSGGAGLKQNEGLFSAKNLGFSNNGSTSDDILLVGIETIENEVFIHFYPVEVKIGQNSPSYIEKGIKQAKSTKKIFNETLLPKEGQVISSTQRIYRNFLMQLVITSAEKFELYNIYKDEGWDTVINSDLRRKLLNEEYEISNSMEKTIGEAAVISFKKGSSSNGIRQEDGITIIEMSEDDGINFITKSVDEIRKTINRCNIDEIDKKLLTPEEKLQGDGNGSEDTIIDCEERDNDKGKPEDEIIDEYSNEKGMEIQFGLNEKNNREVYWHPNDTNEIMHTNTGIIGTMGTGKTQFTKSMITQIHKQSEYNVDSEKIGILVFDYKGDYNKSKQDFMDATNAKVFDLYRLPFNPLSISDIDKPMLPLHTANALKETLAKAFNLGIKQETLLRDLIMEAYEKKGIIKNEPDTWKLPAPTLKDVYDIYTNKEDLKKDSLYSVFSDLIDFEIFELDSSKTKSLFDLIDGVTVIDLSGYDSGIQNLIVAITLDLFYMQMQAHGHSKIYGHLRQMKKFILVDEADNFLSKDFTSLKNILKEGREYGVGTILSTQLLSHFSTSENDYANYILSWVIHKVDDIANKDIRNIFNTQTKQEDEKIFNDIKNLNKHHSMVKMGQIDRPIYMEDKAFWQLIKE